MSSHASLRRMVRRARRMPGYRPLRRQVLGRLRQSETARDIVTRIFAGPDVGRRVSPRPYPPEGNLLHGEGTAQVR